MPNFLCRWLGDDSDQNPWENWDVQEESDLALHGVVSAASSKAAARVFLAQVRQEFAPEVLPGNTRLGVRPAAEQRRFDELDPERIETPEGGKRTRYLVGEFFAADRQVARLSDGLCEGVMATSPEEAAVVYLRRRATYGTITEGSYLLVELPGTVKLWLAQDDHSDRVVAGDPADLKVVDANVRSWSYL